MGKKKKENRKKGNGKKENRKKENRKKEMGKCMKISNPKTLQLRKPVTLPFGFAQGPVPL